MLNDTARPLNEYIPVPKDTPALGNKGRKPVQMSRVPVVPLKRLAEHFSKGADKYPDTAPGVSNWSHGLAWSDSYNALQRHLLDWWSGEDLDEDGNRNLDAVMWHAVVLSEYTETHPELDDRPKRRNVS